MTVTCRGKVLKQNNLCEMSRWALSPAVLERIWME